MIDFAQKTYYNICMNWKWKWQSKVKRWLKDYEIALLTIGFLMLALLLMAYEEKQNQAKPEIVLDKPIKTII